MRSAIILSTLFAGFCALNAENPQSETARENLFQGSFSGRKTVADRKIARNGNSELERENARLKRENAVLRKELIETLYKYSTQAGRLKRMEMSAAGTLETLDLVCVGAREVELAGDLQTSLSMIGRLSAGMLKFYGEASALLPVSMPENKPESIRLRLELEKLKYLGEVGSLFASPAKEEAGELEHCRILELTDSPELVILSGGYRDGIRTGMLLDAGGTGIRVLAVRSFVSAGIPMSGTMRGLAPGMRVRKSGVKNK